MISKDSSYRANYIDSLRVELLDVVKSQLNPVSKQLGYSDLPLESKIQWLPCVLVLGNYSSGKSTFINHFLGKDIQRTGQAPTDDSFTVIAYDKECENVEERDGKALLGGSEFPFAGLRKYGQRFASHFRLKKCNAAALKGLAIIDTPGMLDSVTENDRGYDYQKIVGELAEIADLIIVMFDPHKAGTVRETYDSLRRTLPKATYEDRVLFILNRVDECGHLNDLLRVYGTLCWNLSQMTGRKDIPHIWLTWAEEAADYAGGPPAFLQLLQNQRRDIQLEISRSPQHRLDHMLTFIEEQSANLESFTKAVLQYKQETFWVSLKLALIIFPVSLFLAFLGPSVIGWDVLGGVGNSSLFVVSVGGAAGLMIYLALKPFASRQLQKRVLKNLAQIVDLRSEYDRDIWAKIEVQVASFIKESSSGSLGSLKGHLKKLKRLRSQKLPEFRKALEEMPR